jgi:hypothetical protein
LRVVTISKLRIPLVVVAAVTVIAMSSAKQLRRTETRGDVEVYIHGARLVLGGADLYAVPEPRGRQPYLYLPLFACMAIPLTLVPIQAAVVGWSALNLALAGWIVVAFFRAMSGRSFFSLAPKARWIIGGFTVLLTLRALLYHLDLGQANLVVMAIAVFGLRHVASSSPVGAGVALGVASILKTIALPLWIPFLSRCDVRVVAGMTLGVFVGLLLPALLVGFDRNLTYISYWVTDVILSAGDLRQTPYWPLGFNYSLAAQLYRFFGDVVSFEHDGRYYSVTVTQVPDAALRVMTRLVPLLVGLVIASFAWVHRRRHELVSVWGAVALSFCLAPAFSLVAHKHYWVMLLPAHLYVMYLWHALQLEDRWFRGLVVGSFIVATLSTTLFDFFGALMSNLGGLVWGSVLLAAAIFRAAVRLRRYEPA